MIPSMIPAQLCNVNSNMSSSRLQSEPMIVILASLLGTDGSKRPSPTNHGDNQIPDVDVDWKRKFDSCCSCKILQGSLLNDPVSADWGSFKKIFLAVQKKLQFLSSELQPTDSTSSRTALLRIDVPHYHRHWWIPRTCFQNQYLSRSTTILPFFERAFLSSELEPTAWESSSNRTALPRIDVPHYHRHWRIPRTCFQN